MSEQRGLQQHRRGTGPVDNPVEGIQLARIRENEQHKRSQAEEIKVRGAPRRESAEQNEYSNDQIQQPHHLQRAMHPLWPTLRVQSQIELDRAPLAQSHIAGLRSNAQPENLATHFRRLLDSPAVNAQKDIAGLQSRLLGGARRRHVSRHYPGTRVNPKDTVIRKLIAVLLAQVHCTNGDNGDPQQGQGDYPKLKSQRPHRKMQSRHQRTVYSPSRLSNYAATNQGLSWIITD